MIANLYAFIFFPYSAIKDDLFYEKTDELSSPELRDYFKASKINLKEGQRAEVNLEMLDWVKNISY